MGLQDTWCTTITAQNTITLNVYFFSRLYLGQSSSQHAMTLASQELVGLQMKHI